MRILIISLYLLSACQAPTERNVQIQDLASLPIELAEPDPPSFLLPPLDSGWVDLQELDSTLVIDIRYATTNNFVESKMYPCARCLLRAEVAQALLFVQRKLQVKGLGLKFYDCYRPWSVQKALWEKMPDARYVTRPEKGSMHNRGGAVDLTIIDQHGDELDMGTPYDFFGEEAYHTFTELPDSILSNRELLKSTMLEAGFHHIRTEWWHYSFQKKMYELSDYQWPCPSDSVVQ